MYFKMGIAFPDIERTPEKDVILYGPDLQRPYDATSYVRHLLSAILHWVNNFIRIQLLKSLLEGHSTIFFFKNDLNLCIL